jgi:uncharacterized protein YjdB
MKKTIFLRACLLLAALALSLAACSSGGDDGGTKVAVTAVSLANDDFYIVTGNTRQLGWVVEPADASNPAVTFKSSNTAAATVNGTGLVTAKAAGTADITVTTKDGSETDTVKVTVVDTEEPVTNLTIPAAGSVYVGAATKLNLTITPTTATSGITWQSSNTDVATVKGGVVTGVSEGTATITVSSGSVSDTCTVNVTIPEKKLTVTDFPSSMSDMEYGLMLSKKALSNDEILEYMGRDKEPDAYADGDLDGTSIIEAALGKSENAWKGEGDYYIYIGIMNPEAQSEADYFVGAYRSKNKIAFELSTEVRELKFTDFQTVKMDFGDDDGKDDDGEIPDNATNATLEGTWITDANDKIVAGSDGKFVYSSSGLEFMKGTYQKNTNPATLIIAGVATMYFGTDVIVWTAWDDLDDLEKGMLGLSSNTLQATIYTDRCEVGVQTFYKHSD